MSKKEKGKIRVGKLTWDKTKHKDVFDAIEGYETVIVKSYPPGPNAPLGSTLSPFYLRNEDGQLHENIWQFSKVYPKVDRQYQTKNAPNLDKYVVWEWPEQDHLVNDQITEDYNKWRQAGLNNKHPVRYPNGYHGRHLCKFSLWRNPKTLGWERLDYVKSRAKIYAPVYVELAKKEREYSELKRLYDNGVNLLLLDVDGPEYNENQEPFDKVHMGSLEIDDYVLEKLLHNQSQPFCHCYALAGALMGLENVWESVE